MLGVAIELRTQCGGCGQPLPLNACADRVTCGACNRPVEIAADRWKGLLEDAVENVTDLAPDEGKTQTIMTGAATYQLMYGHQAPRCPSCKTNVPEEAAAFADRGWTVCVGCGKRMSVRRAPASLAPLGVTHLVGEDTAQLGGAPGAAPKAASPVVLYCPNCKAPLSVDGSTRMCKCQYCSTDVYLPDDLWQRLHPAATVARWYLWLADVDLAARKRSQFEWYGLSDAVMDADRNIYCCGDVSGGESGAYVWCLGPDLQVRWFAHFKDWYDDHCRIAYDPANKRLVLWEKGKHSVAILSATDGSVITRLGGKQPDDARVHHLDMDDARWMRCDVDGTMLALISDYLVRFSADGTGIATWPPRKGLFGTKEQKLHPLYGPGHQLRSVDGPYIENVGSHPTTLDDYTNLHIGWDGRLYAERSEHVACFDREGNRLYRVKLPTDSVEDRLGSDAAGNLYVYSTGHGDPRPRSILRVSPDGKRVDTIATDRLQGGTVGTEDELLVAPDGTIILMRYWMCIRVLGPDGRLLWQSERSKEVQQEEDEQIAKRA